MSRYILPVIILALLATRQSPVIGGETLYFFYGSPAVECLDVHLALNLLAHSPSEARKLLQEVIDRDPEHELAHALLAREVLESDDPKAALSLVKPFIDSGKPSPTSVSVAVKAAKSIGDKELLLEYLRLSKRKNEEEGLRNAVADDWATSAQIAELLGRREEAVRLLTPDIDTPPHVCVLKLWELGRLRMREEEYRGAREAFTESLCKAEQCMPNWVPFLESEIARSLRALNKDNLGIR